MKKSFVILSGLVILVLAFRLLFGIFVTQPVGTLTEGATVVYWRAGLDLPFIASVEGLLIGSGSDKAFPGRAVQAGQLLTQISDRKVMKLGYSETLFDLSTREK